MHDLSEDEEPMVRTFRNQMYVIGKVWQLIKKQIYMKTETCKLYSRVFWIFLPNVIKIDPYNFEL